MSIDIVIKHIAKREKNWRQNLNLTSALEAKNANFSNVLNTEMQLRIASKVSTPVQPHCWLLKCFQNYPAKLRKPVCL